MPFDVGNNPNTVNSLEVVLSNFEDLQQGAEDVLLPEIKWNQVIPLESIDTSINPGARSTRLTCLLSPLVLPPTSTELTPAPF